MKRVGRGSEKFVTVLAVLAALVVNGSWAVRLAGAAQILSYSYDDTVAYNWIDISATGQILP